MPARTRVFIDRLVEQFSGPECAAIEERIVQRGKTRRASPG